MPVLADSKANPPKPLSQRETTHGTVWIIAERDIRVNRNYHSFKNWLK